MQASHQVTSDGWTLKGSTLSPTHARLQAHTKQIAQLNSEQPMVTFNFPSDPARTLTIHPAFLISAGGPLKALVTAPFSEATTNTVTSHDSFRTFEVLYKFLYCLPIDMSDLPADIPLVAHRWQMHTIFEACFIWAEISQNWNSCLLIEHWMTLLALVQPPHRFCQFFASVVGTEFDNVAASLESRNWMWGKSNVWDVFQSRHILKDMIHGIVHFAKADYSELLLDVILSQLEHKLSSEEAAELLRELDWHMSACTDALQNVKIDKWSANAWRLLALTPNTGQPSDGEVFRMRWAYRRFGTDFRNAPVCETREGFAFNGLSFSMSLQSWCWKDPLSLKLKIRQSPQSVLRRFGRRRVSVVVGATEGSCSCGLFAPNEPDFKEYIGEPWPHVNINELTLDCFAKDGGVEYVLMEPREFEMWRDRHQDCGLLFSVRLRVLDEETEEEYKDQQKSWFKRNCIGAKSRRYGSFSKCHSTCPCVRCRIERRTRGDQGHSSLRSADANRYGRHGHLELSLLSLS